MKYLYLAAAPKAARLTPASSLPSRPCGQQYKMQSFTHSTLVFTRLSIPHSTQPCWVVRGIVKGRSPLAPRSEKKKNTL